MNAHNTCQISRLDEIYDKYFSEYLDKEYFFIEVGAYDGMTYSNTYHLACNGWRGIYVEPIHHLMNKCRVNHETNHVAFLEVACSNQRGVLNIYGGPNIFTANKDFFGENIHTVPCIQLNDIFQIAKLCGQQVNLLVIDVEFYEKEVLQGFNLEYYKPKMVIIEAHENNKNQDYSFNADFINEYFASYDKIYSDEINNIYVIDSLSASV